MRRSLRTNSVTIACLALLATSAPQLAAQAADTAAWSDGRTTLTIWSTLFGTWLGAGIPEAFGADTPEPYGAGLLLGAPAGFFAGRFYRDSVSTGQARTIVFASLFGTWQGFGWRDVASANKTARPRVGAAVVGGLAGVLVGGVAAHSNVSEGDAALVQGAGLWGTWYGFALATMAGRYDDRRLGWTLAAGAAGVLAGAATTSLWNGSAGRVTLISAAGVAGGAAGLGCDLLFRVHGDKGLVAWPAVGSLVGLATGALLTRGTVRGPGGGGLALVSVRDGRVRLGLPWPLPTVIRVSGPGGSEHRAPSWRPAVRLTLLDVHP